MSTPKASDIRTWAQQQGITVSDRGRLPQEVVTAYNNAHDGPKPAQVAPAKSAKATQPVVRRASKPRAKAPVRGATGTAPAEVRQPATAAPADDVLEKRVTELEKQVLSLTERLDAAVTALTKRSRSFSLSGRK